MLGTKLSWRGARARVLRLSETSLSTHDPADGRPTNTWRLAEVVSAEVHGLVLQLRFSGACALCGLIVPTLSFSLPDVCHCFRKGHKIMVHVQSSFFPL